MPKTSFIHKSIYFLKFYLGFFIFHIITASLFREFSAINPLANHYHTSLWSEPLMLQLIFMILVVLTARVSFSLFLTGSLYITLLLINTKKAATLQIPVFPSDFFHFTELLYNEDALKDYWPALLIATVLLSLFIMVFIKTKPNPKIKQYQKISVGLLLLLITTFAFTRNYISQWITAQNIRLVKANMLSMAQQKGFLTFFLKRLIDYKNPPEPDNYSKEKIMDIINKYHATIKIQSEKNTKPNVIILLVEAFTDPKEAGFETTYDPIPNFREISRNHISGKVLVPVIGGRSANSEFELLTGLSMRYIPDGSIPYIDVIDEPMPSIAREFKTAGYFTEAIHVASLSFFNYKLVYPFLAFDAHYTLHGKNVEKDPANRYPSERSLVKEIIKRTQKEAPQFIFSFPNSTHGFWQYDSYLDSDLEITNWPSEIQKNDIKTYVNSLHSADAAFGELINYYNTFDEETVILIAGDHMPGLLSYRFNKLLHTFQQSIENPEVFNNTRQMRNAYNAFETENPPQYHATLHQVPYLIWTNFEAPPLKENTSINLLHDYLFSLSGHSPSPLYQLTRLLRSQVKEVSKVLSDSHDQYTFDTPSQFKEIMSDYELLQYDILYGKNHYTKWLLANEVSNHSP